RTTPTEPRSSTMFEAPSGSCSSSPSPSLGDSDQTVRPKPAEYSPTGNTGLSGLCAAAGLAERASFDEAALDLCERIAGWSELGLPAAGILDDLERALADGREQHVHATRATRLEAQRALAREGRAWTRVLLMAAPVGSEPSPATGPRRCYSTGSTPTNRSACSRFNPLATLRPASGSCSTNIGRSKTSRSSPRRVCCSLGASLLRRRGLTPSMHRSVRGRPTTIGSQPWDRPFPQPESRLCCIHGATCRRNQGLGSPNAAASCCEGQPITT